MLVLRQEGKHIHNHQSYQHLNIEKLLFRAPHDFTSKVAGMHHLSVLSIKK